MAGLCSGAGDLLTGDPLGLGTGDGTGDGTGLGCCRASLVCGGERLIRHCFGDGLELGLGAGLVGAGVAAVSSLAVASCRCELGRSERGSASASFQSAVKRSEVLAWRCLPPEALGVRQPRSLASPPAARACAQKHSTAMKIEESEGARMSMRPGRRWEGAPRCIGASGRTAVGGMGTHSEADRRREGG